MKTNAKVLALALLLTGSATPFTQAQTQAGNTATPPPVAMNAPAPDGPMGPGDHGPGGPGKHGPKHQPHDRRPGGGLTGLTALTTISGTVGQLTSNDDFMFDGFTINAGSGGTTTVKFPPHLGEQLQKAVKPGSTVSVTGYTEGGRNGENRFRLNSLTAGKTTVQDTPPVRPTTPPAAPTMTSTTGKIADYRLDRGGRVNGLVLDDKTIVRIPSHVAYQLTNLATKGSTITVQGYPVTLHNGQVQLEKVNILRASLLTINGQQYLVR